MYSDNFAAAIRDLFEFLICWARQDGINNGTSGGEPSTLPPPAASNFARYQYFYFLQVSRRP